VDQLKTIISKDFKKAKRHAEQLNGCGMCAHVSTVIDAEGNPLRLNHERLRTNNKGLCAIGADIDKARSTRHTLYKDEQRTPKADKPAAAAGAAANAAPEHELRREQRRGAVQRQYRNDDRGGERGYRGDRYHRDIRYDNKDREDSRDRGARNARGDYRGARARSRDRSRDHSRDRSRTRDRSHARDGIDPEALLKDPAFHALLRKLSKGEAMDVDGGGKRSG
jgi:hypothetical protein